MRLHTTTSENVTLVKGWSWLMYLYLKILSDISPSKNIHRDHHSSSDKRDGNHTESRNMSAEQKKEIQQRLSGTTDRGSPVVKTSCVHTTALPTVVYR